jgi:hypothetical protein
MASLINPALPAFGEPTTQSVRDNFAHAKAEIEALQSGGASAGFPNGSTLPTSSLGLAPGTLWNNGGFVCVA